MSSSKQQRPTITVTATVREIIADIVELNERFMAITSKMAEAQDHRVAMELGLDRKHVESEIKSASWRLSLAATGQLPKLEGDKPKRQKRKPKRSQKSTTLVSQFTGGESDE